MVDIQDNRVVFQPVEYQMRQCCPINLNTMKRGKTLRQLRRMLDLTQENIATDVGISQRQVSRIENEQAHARIDHLEAWCATLGITVRKLEKLCEEDAKRNRD